MTPEEAERLLGLAREAKLVGPQAPNWHQRLAPMRAELLEAARVLATTGQGELAAELAAGVWRVWLVSGDVEGGQRLMAAALEGGEARPSRARALALYGAGALAFRAGRQAESRERNEAALAAARQVKDREAEALALVGLSRVAFRDGDYARVRWLATQARELVRGMDPATGVAPLHLLAAGTRLAGDYDEAVRLYDESLALNRRLGDQRMVLMELHNIGHVELHRGNVERALRCFAECAGARNYDDPYEAAMTDLNRAAAAFAHGEHRRAMDRLRRSRSKLEEAGIVLDPDDAFEVEWLEAQLGDAAG